MPVGKARTGSPSRVPNRAMLRVAPASILAVASGKGGVGKTWFSITLAHAFAARGERVLLVDGDLGLANVDVQLGISPSADLAAVVQGWVELENAVIGINAGAGKGGFDVLAGRSGSGQLANLPQDEIARLVAGLAVLSLHYDKVILDLAAGVDDAVMRLARAADAQILVLNDEPPSMTDAYAFIKMLRHTSPNAVPFVVINMAEGRVAGRRTYESIAKACQDFLHFRPLLAGIIGRDPKVREAVRAQTPLPSLEPRAPAALDVSTIAEALSKSLDTRR